MPDKVWECCHCRTGPYNTSLYKICPFVDGYYCNHKRCRKCDVSEDPYVAQRRDRGAGYRALPASTSKAQPTQSASVNSNVSYFQAPAQSSSNSAKIEFWFCGECGNGPTLAANSTACVGCGHQLSQGCVDRDHCRVTWK